MDALSVEAIKVLLVEDKPGDARLLGALLVRLEHAD